MIRFKKIFLFFIIFFFLLIPKASAKYIFSGEIQVAFEIQEAENQEIYVEITSVEDFCHLRDLVNSGENDFDGIDIYLTEDIDLSSVSNWVGIGTELHPFKGNFYGNSHMISNLKIEANGNSVGLFGCNSGTICDLKVSGEISANGFESVGGIAGTSIQGDIYHCINYCKISGGKYSGGICGYAQDTMIECCGNETDIQSSDGYCGGICGYCTNENSSTRYVIRKCYNYGTIEGDYAIGGIAGGAWNSNGAQIVIRSCYNMGTIKCDAVSNGGILGGTYYLFDASNTDVSKNVIEACYNLGKIEAISPNQLTNTYATIQDCYFLSGQKNTSGYGKGKIKSSFQGNSASSVWYGLNRLAPGDWVLTNINQNYPSLAWQNE